MLANITSYWFVTLPAVFTGFYLLRVLKHAQEAKTTKERVPVAIENSSSKGKYK